MAAKLADVLEEMKAVLRAGRETRPRERCDKILELIAEFLRKALARDEERGQVAILMVNPALHQLVFAYPFYLARGNVLPLDLDSFAGQVVLRNRVLLENRVPAQPHKDYFERIAPPGQAALTIQKMIAAPLSDAAGEVIGVIEVSRTGDSAAEAGADFTVVDVQNLEKCCRVFAPFVARTWRERGM